MSNQDLVWIYGARLRRTYLGTGKAAELYPYIAFLPGLRGRLERVAVCLSSRWTHAPATEPEVQAAWTKLCQAMGNVTNACLLYTDYYKETVMVGPLQIDAGSRYFMKVFKHDAEAQGEARRAIQASAIAGPHFRTARLLLHQGPVVAYELIDRGPGVVTPELLEQRGTAMATDALASPHRSAPLRAFVQLAVLSALYEARPAGPALDFARIAQFEALIPVVPCHGDFTPWNTFMSDRQELYLIDYERVGEGPPFSDIFHLHTQPQALTGITTISSGLVERVAAVAQVSLATTRRWYMTYLLQQLETDLGLWIRQGKRHPQLKSLIASKAALLEHLLQEET